MWLSGGVQQLTFGDEHRVIEKRELAQKIHLYRVVAPLIANKAKAGHFVIVRAHERAERIPLTIVNSEPDDGTISLVVQEMGRGTAEIAGIGEGDKFAGIVGPLGRAGDIARVDRVVLIAGGVGVAPMLPYAKAYHCNGTHVTTIIGAKTREMLILLDEMESFSDVLMLSTDDGSLGTHGFVSDVLVRLLADGQQFDHAVCIGPAIMMRAVCEITREKGIPTTVSLNPIMIDGTGMCGGCRVTVGGEVKFACVDGPEFDGHAVDFDELMSRQRFYAQEERSSYDSYRTAKEGGHRCQLDQIG